MTKIQTPVQRDKNRVSSGVRSHRVSGRGMARVRAAAVIGAISICALGAVQASGATTGGGGVVVPDSVPFGYRTLRVGMTGPDVKILNGIVKSKTYSKGVTLTQNFKNPTAVAVKRFQGDHSLRRTGIVNSGTAKALTRTMKRGGASWYGPGMWGNQTACGQTLRPRTIGVAHKTLPCGTKVTFQYHGRAVIARVIDRGPYVKGRMWDLTAAAQKALNFDGVANIRYAIAK